MNIKTEFTKHSINPVSNNNPASPPLDPIRQRLVDKLKEHKMSRENHRRHSYHSPKITPEKVRSRLTARKNKLKIIALGGYEEIGKNCTAIEYGNDIIIIDLGFQFPDKDMPGVDYVLPDISYLLKNKNKLRGIFISHGHLDHTGAIPYLLPKLGHIPVFSSRLTISLLKQRLEEFPGVTASLKAIDPDNEKIRLGCFTIEFFRVNHNIPDAISIVVHTPEGTVIHTGDFKIDFTPATDEPANLQRIAQVGSQKVLALISESTNAHQSGHTISEKTIGENLDLAISKCPGRIIVSTFSSLLSRIQQIIDSAHKYNRKVCFTGRSMLQNVEIATKLKFFKLPRDILIHPNELNKLADNRVIIIATGSQGQESSAVGRMALGEHRQVRIKKTDTVILSSSSIPGNESIISNMIDNLIRQGARVIDDKNLDIHASGHASSEDLKIMLSLIKPKYLLPAHGVLNMRYAHCQIGQDLGIPEDNCILLDNGQIAEFSQGQLINSKTKVPSGLVFVDGLGVGDIGNVVIRDRQQLSGDGMIVIIAKINKDKPATADGDIDIISRGFVYMKEANPLMNEIRSRIIKIINERAEGTHPDLVLIRNRLRDEIGSFVFEKTQRRPMVIPMTIEV